MSFNYDDSGIRTSKTVNGVTHTYYLNGSQIVAEEWGDKLLVYLYDASGSPIGMMFRKTSYATNQWDVYWFEKNLQGDILSVYNSENTINRNWDFPSPYTIKFRAVRFMLQTGEYETVVTSLPRNKFSASNIKELYHMRWGFETSFRDLKYSVGLIILHCKKDEFVVQEIYAALIMYNYCSRVWLQTQRSAKVKMQFIHIK